MTTDADNELQFTLVGDTMLGRLVRCGDATPPAAGPRSSFIAEWRRLAQVDQFFPNHILTAPEDSLHASYWNQRHSDIAAR
jgi:hypothetical protein